MKRHYLLTIDGPLLRNQRQLLLKLLDAAHRKTAFRFEGDNDHDLLAGLSAMLDEIADRAHDRFGIDCLLETTDEEADQTADGDRCDCEKPGFFCSGVPGILAHVENSRVARNTKVEHCDLCKRYPSDEAAREKLRQCGILDL